MDPIANMLVSIKNGYMAKKLQVNVPYSRFNLSLAQVLEKEKFIGKVQKADNQIEIELIYPNQKPRLTQVKRISKPGLRVYTKSKNIKSVKGGKGIYVVSTPQGLMSGHDARSKKLGGEIICQLW